MGKKGYKGRRGRRKAGKKNQAPSSYNDGHQVNEIVKRGNLKMECYYALQGLHDTRIIDGAVAPCCNYDEQEEERKRWRKSCGEILPSSFRIGKDVPESFQKQLTQELETLLKEASEYVPPPPSEAVNDSTEEPISKAENNTNKEQEEEIQTNKNSNSNKASFAAAMATPDELDFKMQKIPFVPHGYQMGLDRKTIRKNPALTKLHEFLKKHVEAGHLTRQEAVSMVPPILLQVQYSDCVLDMCAAPGSKTSQLLEDLSCGNRNNDSDAAAGVLVANDASSSRAYMLVHQLRRILHHHPVALVTATPAQFFPSTTLQFDKILCDVPCSGDGTTRKNVQVWKTWSNSGAIALHSLQLSIAQKGAFQLLKVNGIMCYSTCSLNPVENEAVVAQLLRESNGGLELLDLRLLLAGFQTRPGWSTWKVMCEDTSRRDQKNQAKKNNAKMQARRKAYEEQVAAGSNNNDDDDDKKNTKETSNGDKAVEISAVKDTGDVVEEGNEQDGDKTMPATGSYNEEPANGSAQPGAKDKESNGGQPKATNEDGTTSAFRVFAPTTFDHASLIELAAKEGLVHYPTFEDVPAKKRTRIRQSAFPPTKEEAEQFHLERCIRCLPQDNDTGGFFVAMLQKKKEISGTDRRLKRQEEQANEPNAMDEKDAPDAKRAKLKSPDEANVEELEEDKDMGVVDDDALEGLDEDNKPVTRGFIKRNLIKGQDVGKDDFAPVKEGIMESLVDYYGLADGFDKDLYMARVNSDSKVLYYIGKPVKRLFDLGIQTRVTIVTAGLKAFIRNSRNLPQCEVEYRACQEAIHFLVPFMSKRKYVVGLADFKRCLTGAGKPIHLSNFTAGFREQLKDLTVGSIVVILEGYEDQMHEKFVLTMWKCRGESIDLLVAKAELDTIVGKLRSLEET